MFIPNDQHEKVRAVNIDEHRTKCIFEYWEKTFPNGTYIAPHVRIIKDSLGTSFTRSELVAFYRKKDIQPESKFVAAMIWGHEAPAGSRRDSRGPWRLSETFAQADLAETAIRSVSIATDRDIVSSYKKLEKQLKGCGPNFFTKHFYFLGKSQGLKFYPLIFDDRVASGLVKLVAPNRLHLELVQIGAIRKPKAYLAYLEFAKRESARIGCEPDQIEYYLFNL